MSVFLKRLANTNERESHTMSEKKDKSVYEAGNICWGLENYLKGKSQLYTDKCINYTGKTEDTGEYYTEVIAKWLMEPNHLEKLINIESNTRDLSYKTNHENTIQSPDNSKIESEKELAKRMHKQEDWPILGKIIDYQIPLKNKQTDESGEIDLLAYDEERDVVRILELKRPDNKETMLRCALEGYTYSKIVDKKKLLLDFGLPKNASVRVCPFVAEGGKQHQEMKEGRPQVRLLMEKLGIIPLYYSEDDNKVFTVKEDA